MSRTQYYTATSLDGFIADPDNSLDWLFQFHGEEPGGDYPDFIKNVGALVMGSTTYEWLLDHEKLLEPDGASRWPYKQPTWIFTSRNLPAVQGADIRFAHGDVRAHFDEMVAAADGKNLWVVGGGDLAGQFYDHDLLDDIIVTIASVTLGGGAPLLPRRIVTPPLRLVSVEQWGAGFAQLRYEVRAR
jgi:dihydrofolate reductase